MDLETELTALAPGLLRYCLGRTGDHALAEEVAQEAMTALVARWRRSGRPDSPAAFTFAVARRRAGRALWKRRLLAPLEAIVDGHDPGPSPEQNALDQARRAALCQALGRLATRDREALLLAAAGELDTATGSRALGISPSAFKMRVHRARRRLADILGEIDGGT